MSATVMGVASAAAGAQVSAPMTPRAKHAGDDPAPRSVHAVSSTPP